MEYAFIIALFFGWLVGITQGGVHINIKHKDDELPTDEEGKPIYNESMADKLPADMQQYYENTGGQNRF